MAKKKSQAEELLLADLIAAGYQPEAECDFHSEANWKFDLAFPEIKLAIEIDGAGRHNMLQGQRRDQNKRNAALELGWRVLLYPAASVTTAKRRERIVEQISRVICGVACEQQSTIVLEGD